jgi:hypothetical protein
VLVPECCQPLVDALQLGGGGLVPPLAEHPPQLGAPFAQGVDLRMDLIEYRHGRKNA